MTKKQYASLHTHSHNSLLDGYSTINEYVQRAVDLGLPGMGLTDHGNNFGIYDFLKATKSADIKGLPGCEFYVAPENPEGAFNKERIFYGPGGKKVDGKDVAANGSYLHLTVWAYNNEGLKNLFKLSTLSFSPDRWRSKPRIDFNMLAENSDGLIVATGCPSSEINTRFRLGQDAKAYEYTARLLEIFGRERLYVEIMDHKMEIELERELTPKHLELAKHFNLPLLATNDSHHANPGEELAHEQMLCKQSGAKMSDPTFDEGGNRFALSGQDYHMASYEEIISKFPEDDFPGAVKNSLKILEMSEDITLNYDAHLHPQPQLPEGEELVPYYRKKVREGLRRRYDGMSEEVLAEARERNKIEDEVIVSSGFTSYMIVVADYLNWTRENFSTRDDEDEVIASAIGPGRGSVGGSIHAYALGISEVDPIRWGLFFERFLSAGRGPTYKITYEDGTTEEIIASDKKSIYGDIDGNFNSEDRLTKYIHELAIGDAVAD